MSNLKQKQQNSRVDLSTFLATTSGGALLFGSFLGIGGAALGSVLGASFSLWAQHVNQDKRPPSPPTKTEHRPKAVAH